MAISLSKGARIDLSKEAPTLNLLRIGLGWNPRVTDGQDFDADASLLMLDKDGKSVGETGFIFYGNKNSDCGSIVHNGDNKTGEGLGDDETIDVILNKVPENVVRMLVAVSIHDAETRGQTFGQIDDAYIRIVDTEKLDAAFENHAPENDKAEVARYDLTEDSSTETCMIFAEVYRKDGTWRVQAKGEGFAGGLLKFLESYGFEVK